MIKNDKEYENAKQALEDIEKALIDLKKNVYSKDPERYYIMAESYIDYINKIRCNIDQYSGFSEAIEKSLPLWIRLKGPHIGEGNARISVLAKFLNDFKLGVQRVALYLSSDMLEEVGRPNEVIRGLSDFKAKILPGSLRIGISFPSLQTQATLDDKPIQNPVKDSVKKILEVASWAVRSDEKIESLVPDERERNLILSQLDKIAPTSDGEITNVEFKGKIVSKDRILLTNKSTIKIREAIAKTVPPESITAEGVMREIDLDEQHFILRERLNNEKDIRCEYDESLKEDAKDSLDKHVKVFGELIRDKYKKARHINVQKIEIIGSRFD